MSNKLSTGLKIGIIVAIPLIIWGAYYISEHAGRTTL